MQGILTDNGNLVITNSDLTIGEAQAQWAEHLIGAFTGEYKHAPLLGGNIKRMIAGTPDPFWEGSMKSQLKSALVDIKSLRIKNGQIELELND